MNRMMKKCLIGSSALHALLLGILLFGSGFFRSSENLPPVVPLHVFNASEVTDALSSGGNPNVQAPEAAPAPPVIPPAPPALPQAAPPPAPQRVTVPKPQVERSEPILPPEITPRRLEPVEQPAPQNPHKIVLDPNDLKIVSRRDADKLRDKDSDAKARARAAAAARQAAAALNSAYREIAGGTGGHITLPDDPGVGGGGAASINYRDAVASIYTRAWVPPAGMTDDSATAVVSVTIDRDGNVMSAHIIAESGNTDMDRSVQTTLDNVTFVAPFPAGARESQRSYTIQFNLKAKRSFE
jgi:TonB family protein